ncbi:MAG TPA: FAD-binding protein, partial [bacterium (Candidatus Stahlbacteria)]|nr:FAD-binding protein [Candidatus Stahlbacteria bacterium]
MKDSVIKKLIDICGEDNVKATPAELYVYSTDASVHRNLPDVVVRPEKKDQVVEIVKVANKEKVPIVPRGAGTALCGHAVPIKGGIVVTFQAMDKILKINVPDLYSVVQPGVICDDLNAALKPYNFFFPPDPGSSHSCTIGGMVIANASGQRAIKYGATRDYVMALEAVLPNGDLVKLGAKTLKDASGLQLARLMVGSEGTLGLITEVTLKVVPRPAKTASCVAAFSKLDDAARCVGEIISIPLIPARMELMDSVCIQAVNKAQGFGLPEVEAILLIGVDGHPEVVKEEIAKINETCKKVGATDVKFTEDPKRETELWKARKAMIPSLSKYKEGWVAVMLADDMSVPMSKIPEVVKRFHEIAEKYGILIPTYGHAGDGNLHTKVILDPKSEEHWKAVEKALDEVYDVVHAVGGTTTGEHGSAISKAPFMQKERGPEVVAAMKAIKKALDPNNIMNPNKMMQWEGGVITHLRYSTDGINRDLNLSSWEGDMNICTYCGYCKVVCPTFITENWDSTSARGRLQIAYGLLRSDLKFEDSIARSLFTCTMCKDCYRRCPSKVKVPDIVKFARADLVKNNLATEGHKVMIENIKKTGNIFGDTEIEFPIRDGEVPLFIGCQYLSRPNQTKLYLRILDKLGINVKVMKEVCCGYPMEALGFRDEFEEHKKK